MLRGPRRSCSVPSSDLLAALLLAVSLGVDVSSTRADPSQEQAPQGLRFRSRVELVRLSVSVVDDGRFVPGLGIEDFRLRIDGREREVALVQEIDLGTVHEVGSATETPAGETGELSGRAFVLFLDTVFQRPEKLDVCIQAARYLLRDRLAATDRVALVAFTRRGAVLLQPLTVERGLVLAALDRLRSDWSWRVERALGPSGDAFVVPEDMPLGPGQSGRLDGRELTPDLVPGWQPSYRELTILYVAGLRRLGAALQAEQGRKQLLLYSPGIGPDISAGSVGRVFSAVPGVPDTVAEPTLRTVDDRRASLYELMEAAGEALRDGNVAVHALSTARLVPGGGRRGLHFLWYFSDETGGSKRFHTHHLEADTARAEGLSRRYYLLGYRRAAEDPPRVNVEVRVLRAGVDVRAPTRMALPPPVDLRTDLQRALLGEEPWLE